MSSKPIIFMAGFFTLAYYFVFSTFNDFLSPYLGGMLGQYTAMAVFFIFAVLILFVARKIGKSVVTNCTENIKQLVHWP